MTITRYDGPAALTISGQLADAYGDVFSEPPFNRDIDSIERFRARLATDLHRNGFRALVATTENATGVAGFVTGWITPEPFRTDRAYGTVLNQLGSRAVQTLLIGALEVDELGVQPTARRTGLARQLLTELTAHAPDQRAWLLTPTWATETVAFYHHIGWHALTPQHAEAGDVTVFLSPHHPRI